jgi:hypothetical protein
VAALDTATKLVAGHLGSAQLGGVAHLPAGQVLSAVFNRRCRAAHSSNQTSLSTTPRQVGAQRPGPRGKSGEE